MANVTGLLTINERDIYEIDTDPTSGSGTAAPLSTIGMRSDLGQLWLKVAASDTGWSQVATAGTQGTVLTGTYLRLPIYSVSATGNTLADNVTQNAQTVNIAVASQATRSTPISYTIPNPGDAISSASFILSEGSQTKNGNMTFTNSVTVSSLTANANVRTGAGGILTTGQVILTTEVSGILPIANGGTNSGSALNNGRIMWSTGGAVVEATALGNGQLFIGAAGAAPVAATLTGTSNRVSVTVGSGSITLSGPQDIATTSSPSFANLTVSSLAANSNVRTGAGGILTTGQTVLTTEVSGILPIANGGTNSGTTLTNNQLMLSSGGKIVEAGALTNGQLFIGATGAAPVAATITGTSNRVTVSIASGSITLSGPQDIATTSSPTFGGITINGASTLKSTITYSDAAATNTNYVLSQYQTSTSNATPATLATLATSTDTVLFIEARVVARRTGGTSGTAGDSAVYVRQVKVKNVAGVLTLSGIQSSTTFEDQASWNATFTISGTNVLVQVTGSNNNNVDWGATCITQLIV